MVLHAMNIIPKSPEVIQSHLSMWFVERQLWQDLGAVRSAESQTSLRLTEPKAAFL